MVNHLKLVLNQEEFNALLKLSDDELRNPSDEARHIVREELKRRGLFPSTDYEQPKRNLIVQTGRVI